VSINTLFFVTHINGEDFARGIEYHDPPDEAEIDRVASKLGEQLWLCLRTKYGFPVSSLSPEAPSGQERLTRTIDGVEHDVNSP